MSNFPSLSRLVDRDEMWDALRDFDALMRAAEDRVRSSDALPSEGVRAAQLLFDFARAHYHLFLVNQFKIKEIGRGVVAALNAHNETVLFNLARAFVEHTAALAYQIAALKKSVLEIPKKLDIKTLETVISRHRNAVHRLYHNEKAVIHVNDMIDVLTKHYASAKRDYDELCEFVHPNYGSNKLVSSGQLGTGQIRSHAAELASELNKVRKIIEQCASVLSDDLSLAGTRLLVEIDSWIKIACQDGMKLNQVFSLRSAISGDGRTKETALFFKKARTHQEAIKAFYSHLKSENIVMINRQQAGIEDGFLFDVIATDRGTIWVKYRTSLPL